MSKLIDQIDWCKVNGLIPAIIQHAHSAEVLMLGYMNSAALKQTSITREVTFFSRSKQRLWVKGETSGHVLQLVDIALDCDQDSLLIQALPQGPTCHLNQWSCFGEPTQNRLSFIGLLQRVIAQRAAQPFAASYVSHLLKEPIKVAQKVGEEGVEVALAAVAQTKDHLINEVADLLFHVLVLLHQQQVALVDVMDVLMQRANMNQEVI
ncbi:MAG: bifunctional phosphoribosyl-AMP cyclohydrolase/phosphoribosyl-ATP diphosphatase HisIE [Legionellales bacterium]|nr:bifunctional phosphoribosyl-AMP cyclohydrolase/phosphoribosyl-ATP diphosphatase HisIE [Legionellales bacterium]